MMELSLDKNQFFKEDIPKNVMAVIGLQYINSEFEKNRITFKNEVALDGEPIIILTPEKKMRIIGISR